MQALLTTPEAPAGVLLDQAPDPATQPDEALIEGFRAGDGFGPDLPHLLDLIATDRLTPLDGEHADRHDIDTTTQRLKAADAPRRMIVGMR
ncbi:hypothetical protein ACQPYK_09700 [Streptosporangium sp. CA-135522]|uniref:hypothetical protein n=1 Tax=Streptosporangium sp. CA-135522 TaxID=3240072 RepID=UPI003D934F89